MVGNQRIRPISPEMLLASDHHYFELASETFEIEPGVFFVHMIGLTHVPAGCVAICRPGVTPGVEAVRAIEQSVRALGGDPVRIYTAEGLSDAGHLIELGYSPRRELGFAAEAGALERDPRVTLRPVRSDRDWAAKLAIHEADTQAPDGHVVAASDWVEMERRKCETGGMTAFVIQSQEGSLGSICSMEANGFLRMKNLVVHPSQRRRGYARGAVARLSWLAAEQGFSMWGCFALEGGPAETLYRTLGLEVVGGQVEWTKPCV